MRAIDRAWTGGIDVDHDLRRRRPVAAQRVGQESAAVASGRHIRLLPIGIGVISPES
jgi:hypothetical protein